MVLLHMACKCSLLDAMTIEIVVYLVIAANCDVIETITNGLTSPDGASATWAVYHCYKVFEF